MCVTTVFGQQMALVEHDNLQKTGISLATDSLVYCKDIVGYVCIHTVLPAEQ